MRPEPLKCEKCGQANPLGNQDGRRYGMTDTPEGKRAFVIELVQNIAAEIIGKSDRWPENWDGHELRRLVADHFERAASMSAPMSDRRKSRRRDYENAVMVLDL